MKKHIATTLVVIACVLCCILSMVACDTTPNHSKADEFIRVMDGVFASAGYTVGGPARADSGNVSHRAKRMAPDDTDTPKPSDEIDPPKPPADIDEPHGPDDGPAGGDPIDTLYAALRTADNTAPLTASNLASAKDNALYQGANVAGLFKSMAQVFGDEVFSTLYDLTKLEMPNSVLKLESAQNYILYGHLRGHLKMEYTSLVQMEFQEYTNGKFLFKLAQYSYINNQAELRFSYYDSDRFVFVADLIADKDFDFASYQSAYSDFRVDKLVMAIYDNSEYINTSADSETIMRFAYDTLGYSNQTYTNLLSLSGGKTLTDKNVTDITAAMAKNYYTGQSAGGKDEPKIEGVILPETLTLEEGESDHLNAIIIPDSIKTDKFTWTSSNPAVATVDNGFVYAHKAGTTTITVTTSNGKTDTCIVTVNTPTIEVTNVQINEYIDYVYVGDRFTLTATVTPDNATDATVTWESSNESVATVDNNGNVTVLAHGQVTIKATAGSRSDSRYLIARITPDVFELDADAYQVARNQSLQIVPILEPASWLDGDDMHWSSSDETIATVTEYSGTVYGVKEGTVTITGKAGNKVVTCTVTVIPEATEISFSEYECTVKKNDYRILCAYVTPDYRDFHIEWSSSDESIATVEEYSKTECRITGISAGTAVITATVDGVTRQCVVTVDVPVQSITFDKTEITLEMGAQETITATIAPDDATNKTLTWESRYPYVATVDDNGTITAVHAGTTYITAESSNGYTAQCTVTVLAVAESVTLNKNQLTLNYGDEVRLTATVLPEQAVNKTVTWSTTDPTVATVDNGTVIAAKEGTATISVHTANGLSDQCVVTVNPRGFAFAEIMENDEVVAYALAGVGTIEDTTHIVIPTEHNGKPVTTIGVEAFFGCDMLDIEIPDSITTIERGAFAWCRNLTELYIPDSVTSISERAFTFCESLYQLNVPFTSGYFKSWVTREGDPETPPHGGLKKVIVRSGKIANHEFEKCSYLEEIVLLDDVTEIGLLAFYQCSSLTQITLSANIKSIGNSAFWYCYDMQFCQKYRP